MDSAINTQEKVVAFLGSDEVQDIKFSISNKQDKQFPYQIDITGDLFTKVAKRIQRQVITVRFVAASELDDGVYAEFVGNYPRSVLKIGPDNDVKTRMDVLHESTHAALFYLAGELTNERGSADRVFWGLDEALAFIAEYCLVVNSDWTVKNAAADTIEGMSLKLATAVQKARDHLLNHGQVLSLVHVITHDRYYKMKHRGEPVPACWQ